MSGIKPDATIGIRCDVNEAIATGHFMRCATIADAAHRKGLRTVFLAAEEGIGPYAEERGLTAHVLHTEAGSAQEAEQMVSYLRAHGIRALLVDSYAATPAYLQRLRDAGIRLLYMDDFGREALPAEAVVNYSPAAEQMNYRLLYRGSGTKLLLGARYVPLRAQFADGTAEDDGGRDCAGDKDGWADCAGDEDGWVDCAGDKDGAEARRGRTGVFVTSGGTDPLGIAERIIVKLRERMPDEAFGDGLTIHLLAGRSYRVPEGLQKHMRKEAAAQPDAAQADFQVRLHQNVSDVAGIMRRCKAAATPAGTTLYELCACGVPSVSFVFADNQETDARYFDREGLIPFAGDFRRDAEAAAARTAETLCRVLRMPPEETAAVRGRMRRLIDGKGAARIAVELCRLSAL